MIMPFMLAERRKEMYLVKALNNNTALIKDNTKEYIVMGKGIAFNKKEYDTIDQTKIETSYEYVK